MRRSKAPMAGVLAAVTLAIGACVEMPGGVRAGGPSPAVVVPPEDRDVRVAQVALQAAGYNPGPGKGILNEQTRDAIGAFQRDHGLPPTGVLDRNTFELLKSASGVTTDEHGNGEFD